MYEIFICGWLMILLIDEVVVWKFLVVESKSVLKERCLEVLFVVFDEMEVEVFVLCNVLYDGSNLMKIENVV